MKNKFRFILIISLVVGFTSCSDNKSTPDKDVQKEVPVSLSFDVPSLVKKNIDQIRKVLGTPTDKELEPSKLQMSTKGFDIWDNVFEKDGYTLQITYNPHTRKIIDFFISNDNGSFDDVSILKKVSNVVDGSTDYTLEPVKQIKDNSKYTGLKIIPN